MTSFKSVWAFIALPLLGAACLAMLSRGGDKSKYVPLANATPAPSAKPSSTPRPHAILELIKDHRKWTRVNQDPFFVKPPIAIACAMVGTNFPSGPHEGRYINVYVNSVGREAMLTKDTPRFPAGSIIVKEKFLDNKGEKLEMMTVMIKREKGFNANNGDWEYAAVNGDSTRVDTGDVKHCQTCHQSKQAEDYTFRNYVPGWTAFKPGHSIGHSGGGEEALTGP